MTLSQPHPRALFVPPLLAALLFCLRPSAPAAHALQAPFTPLGALGRRSSSDNHAVSLVPHTNGSLFLAGTTSPPRRNAPSDLGTPLSANLRGSDWYVARMAADGSVGWALRLGTSRDDTLAYALASPDRRFLYVAGSSRGAPDGAASFGRSDMLVHKLDVSSTRPRAAWPRAAHVGTPAEDGVAALALDPDDDDRLFVAGFSAGSLFRAARPKGFTDTDACLFTLSAMNGSLLGGVQFGSEFADHAAALHVAPGKNGPVFVAVITERVVGKYAFGNFHLYKFAKNLTLLGDILLRTYARESLAGLDAHPFMPDTLLSAGASWLDAAHGYDVFVKRVSAKFDDMAIGTVEHDVGEVHAPDFTTRLHSSARANDYAVGQLVHPGSGRLIVVGKTGGKFAPDVSKVGVLSPLVACIDPTNGSLTGAVQPDAAAPDSWGEITAAAWMPDRRGLYLALKKFNDSSSVFDTSVATFRLPDAWLTPISVPSPSPSPSPATIAQQKATDDAEAQSSRSKLILITVVAVCVISVLCIVLFAVRRACLRARRRRYQKSAIATVARQGETVRFITDPPTAEERAEAEARELV